MPYSFCDDYAPIDEYMLVDQCIEDHRAEYRSAWYRYLSENAEDFFI